MKITEFEELTGFLYGEYEKMSEAYGTKRPSKILIEGTEKTLLRYAKLYNKPLYKKAKRNLRLQEAFDTMPHGFWWKFFHSDLWKRMKYLDENLNKQKAKLCNDEQQDNNHKQANMSETLPVEVVKNVFPPQEFED